MHRPRPISQLPDGIPQLIQSSISLPSYPSVLVELIYNAIDAEASRIDCWINPSAWTIRVTDDGTGINKDELKNGLGCERGISSKYHSGEGYESDGSLGFRGQALASMGTIAALEIISRRRGFATTYHKSIKNGQTLSCAPTDRYARATPGTTVILRDMYHSVPVRRVSLKNHSITSTIQTCKKSVEITLLAIASAPEIPINRPDLTITLTLEGHAVSGYPSRRILDIKATADVVAILGNIFGQAFTISSKSFRASAQGIHLRGFISFTGHSTKAHQYVFINGHHMHQFELYSVVREVYASANVLRRDCDEDDEAHDRDGRGLRGGKKEMSRAQSLHPVFVIHLDVPKGEVDHALEPLKNLSFRDVGLVQKVVQKALKNVFQSAGYPSLDTTANLDRPRFKSVLSDVTYSSIQQSNSGHVQQPCKSGSLMPLQPLPFSCNKRYSISSTVDSASHVYSKSAKEPVMTPRPDWLSKVLADRAKHVFPTSSATAQPKSIRTTQPLDLQHDCAMADNRVEDLGLEHFQLSQDDLAHAKVIAQIDDKYICCALPTKGEDSASVLLLVDQHAADERIRVERFLRETLEEFKKGGVASTSLQDAHVVQLLQEQNGFLTDHPESVGLLRRWGFQMSPPPEFASSPAGYTSITVDRVPSLLLSRLGVKGAREVTKIVSGYIAFLQTQPIGSIACLNDMQHRTTHSGLDSAGLLRWMPHRMKELIDSKACRGAIMFNDPLTMEQCVLLIKQLSTASFPFICAHGRPSVYPLVRFAKSVFTVDTSMDWTKQILANAEPEWCGGRQAR